MNNREIYRTHLEKYPESLYEEIKFLLEDRVSTDRAEVFADHFYLTGIISDEYTNEALGTLTDAELQEIVSDIDE